jgi:hypoxanthine phosphoribosyltransferase
MQKRPDFVELKWSDIDFLVDRLIDQFTMDNLNFDSILAIGRGGYVPGCMLSYKLDVKNLQNLGINTRHSDEEIIYQKPNLFGNILVVDDINDSGKTFKLAEKFISKECTAVKNITFCALAKKYNTKYNQGYYGNMFHSNNWMVFPWDK